MNNTQRWASRATSRDTQHFLNPRLWLLYPFLPLIRRPIDSPEEELGVLFDAKGVAGVYGYSSTVFLANLFLMPRTIAELLALPKCVYDNFDELATDGWIVN